LDWYVFETDYRYFRIFSGYKNFLRSLTCKKNLHKESGVIHSSKEHFQKGHHKFLANIFTHKIISCKILCSCIFFLSLWIMSLIEIKILFWFVLFCTFVLKANITLEKGYGILNVYHVHFHEYSEKLYSRQIVKMLRLFGYLYILESWWNIRK
jgi:hypothetical protein